MTISGIATKSATTRVVDLKNPRPNEKPQKTVHELVVLDTSLGQTVTLVAWGDVDPFASINARDNVSAEVTAIRFFAQQLQCEIDASTVLALA